MRYGASDIALFVFLGLLGCGLMSLMGVGLYEASQHGWDNFFLTFGGIMIALAVVVFMVTS